MERDPRMGSSPNHLSTAVNGRSATAMVLQWFRTKNGESPENFGGYRVRLVQELAALTILCGCAAAKARQ
jgi:hypothetical protein